MSETSDRGETNVVSETSDRDETSVVSVATEKSDKSEVREMRRQAGHARQVT